MPRASKRDSRTVDLSHQVDSPTQRHLPLVDLLVDTRAELMELAVSSGLKVLDAMLEEDRAAICGPRYEHQARRTAFRAGTVPSEIVLGGRKVAIRRPRVRRDGAEVPLPTFQRMASEDPLNRRIVEQMLVGVATRQYARSLEPLPSAITTRGTSKSRGLCTDRSLLVMLDGSKALRKAVRDRFGDVALVQRCQVHYADVRIMPIPCVYAHQAGGARVADVGIITAPQGTRQAHRTADSDRAWCAQASSSRERAL